MDVTERFLKYVSFDTASDHNSKTYPSTEKQKRLGEYLAGELKDLGAQEVVFDKEYGYVYATVPATAEGRPTLGLIAHMDTSPEVSGADIKVVRTCAYDGGDIVMDGEGKYILSPKDYPQLLNYVGQDILHTDGQTLLGADDKAGVAEIMTLAERLLSDTSIKHGKIRIAFTPDEEVGGGTDYFDVEGFGCDFAYTVDGGELGEIEFENFNAASAVVAVCGTNIHPGQAKDKMVNAMELAMEFHSLLPAAEKPQHTSGYEGFYHLTSMIGDVEAAKLGYIIRDHDKAKFEARKKNFEDIAGYLNKKYGPRFKTEVKDGYYNMREKIEPHMELIENAKAAMLEAGVTPKTPPIRGGTDGVRLSYMGLPCPNLCTGGHNFHGRYEYIPVASMEKTVEILMNLVTKF